VKELVDLERDFLMKEATFRQAEGLVLADPERLIHKMLAHFQVPAPAVSMRSHAGIAESPRWLAQSSPSVSL
jgi:hypothetical protein